jgi:hypothetical protein
MDKPIESQTASGSAELHIAPEEIDKQPLTPDTQLIAAVAANPSKNDDKQEQIQPMPSKITNPDRELERLSKIMTELAIGQGYISSIPTNQKCVLSLPPRLPLIPPKQK